MGKRQPAEVFPPAEYIKEELAFRGMSQEEFMERIGSEWQRDVLDVLEGKAMSPSAAVSLARAFGTSITLWRRLDAAWWEGLGAALEAEGA